MDPERLLPEPSAHTAEATEVSRAGHVIGSDPAPVPLELGAMVAGRYRLGAQLGQGGSGDVHEALDLELGTQVALKLLRPGVATEATIDRLRQELLLARKVSHPSVCRVFDLGRHETARGTIWFLTMELLRGESLRARIEREGRLGEAAVRALVGPLTAGLEAAHAVGVIHRDLSPANILLVPDGAGERAVITDFGLAIETEAVLDPLATAGTPGYMAPEQVEGKPATPATDVFALGVVLFHALTGEVPWRGLSASETARLRLTVPAPRPRSLRSELPATWDGVLGRCLALDPARRFAGPAEVARAIQPRARGRWPWVAAASVLAIVTGVAMVGAFAGGTSETWPSVAPDLAGPVRTALSFGAPDSIIEGALELDDGDLVAVGQSLSLTAVRGTPVTGCVHEKRCTFIVRMSPRGDIRWVSRLTDSTDIRAHAPALSGHLVIVTGDLSDRADGGEPPAGLTESYVAAFSVDDGELRWLRRLGPAATRARNVATDVDGGIYVTGDSARPLRWDGGWHQATERSPTTAAGFLMALDPEGTVRWATTVEGPDPVRFHGLAVSGDTVVWGGSASGALRDVSGHDLGIEGGILFGFDRRTGQRRWARSLGTTTHVMAASTDRDGSIVAAGWFGGSIRFDATALVSHGSADGWVARVVAEDGKPQWVTRLGGAAWDGLTGVAATETAVWADGRSPGFVDGKLTALGRGDISALLVELSPSGAPRTAHTFGGAEFTSAKARGLVRGQRGGVWVTGTFKRRLVAGSFVLTTDGLNDSFALEIPASRR